MIALVIILFLAVAGLSYFVWNLLRKVERYEEDIQLKDEFIIKFKSMIEESNEKMQKLDEKGAFESEDETGFIFKGLRDIAFGINSYFQNYTSTEEETTTTKK
jgi:hypothetical protein